tara:strand:+ start:282 stop:641 length:360 start_codon:yes stop_codon:yes gene_type:complete
MKEITEDMLNEEITLERFRDFHYDVGEDFLDQTGEGNHLIFGGYLLNKYPHHSAEILEICNNRYGECMSYRDLPELGYSDEHDIDLLYRDFAEFCNLTEALKKRVNAILHKQVLGLEWE